MTTHSKSFSINDVIDSGRVNPQQSLVIVLCLIFNMLDGFDITAMAVTANAVGIEMQIAEDKLGLVFSFSLAGMMLGAMFLASFSDVFGRRRLVIICLWVIGFSVLATAYVSSLAELIALRFISGLGAGAMLASQATLASEYSPNKYRALAVAAVTAGYPLGAMMTGLVAGYIVPDFGWRGMFLLGGVVTLAMALLAHVLLPESLQFLCEKRPKNALLKVNKILARFSMAAVGQLPTIDKDSSTMAEPGQNSVVSNMVKLLAQQYRRQTLILWSSFFMCVCSMYFLMSWTPKLMVNAGYSSQIGNYAFSLFNFGGVIGIFVLGTLATRWMLTTVVCVFSLAAFVLMLLFAISPANSTLLLAIIFLIGVTLQGGFTGLYATAAKLYPTNIRSTGVGWAIGLGRLGAVFGPAIAGYMIASNVTMSMSFMFFAVPMLISGLLAYRLRIR
ncbi:MFS transporter [Dasania marina]|uniref:MFS transporter n=1 Tax=Dasania marina TaxID=471499 RepID=UPI00036A5363|nr:MFS transporter [Dasania marina]